MKLLTIPSLMLVTTALCLLVGCEEGGDSSDSTTSTTPKPKTKSTVTTPGALTNVGSIMGFAYSISSRPSTGGRRALEVDILSDKMFGSADFTYPTGNLQKVTYTNNNGFKGLYSYRGETGQITTDVTVDATFYSSGLHDPDVTVRIGQDKGIIMGGEDFGHLIPSFSNVTESGTFIDSSIELSGSSYTQYETGSLTGSFSNDGSDYAYPNFVAGEVKLRGFSKEFGDDNANGNTLVGVFVVEQED